MLYDFSLLKSFFLACRLRLRCFEPTAFFYGNVLFLILSQSVCNPPCNRQKKSPMLQHGAIVTVKDFYPA